MNLYFDTTANITVGLLDDDFEWLDYSYVISKKSSSVIHSMIDEMLKKFDVSFSRIENIFYCSGPGSYTGMRVTEGIVDILDWHEKNIISFYQFDIPRLAGISKGIWLAKAFKNEIFRFSWNKDAEEKTLMSLNDFEKLSLDGESVFVGHEGFNEIKEWRLSSDFVKNNPKKIFSELKKLNSRKELYYYRSLEEEYTKK